MRPQEALNNTQKELNETDIFSWGKARELVAAREKETEAAKAAQETYMQSVQLYSDLQSETQRSYRFYYWVKARRIWSWRRRY